MASEKSNAAVFAGILGAACIATTQIIAAALSGSAGMLASAIHSSIDTGNNFLLYWGKRRSARPGDAQHPFGHGPELYFWTLIVAVLMFAIAGVVTIAEGVFRIIKPEEISDVALNYTVFAIAAAFNAYSWTVAFWQFRTEIRGKDLSAKLRKAKDPTVLTVLFEDSASLVGVVVAFLGVLLGSLLDMPVLDGVASVIIGVIMGTVATGLVYQCKLLLTGETVNDEVLDGIREVLHKDRSVEGVLDLRTMHLSPDNVLVNMRVCFRPDLSVRELSQVVERLEDGLRHRFPELQQISIAPARPHDAA